MSAAKKTSTRDRAPSGRQRRALEALYMFELAGRTPTPLDFAALGVIGEKEARPAMGNVLSGLRTRGWLTWREGERETMRLTPKGNAQLWAEWAPLPALPGLEQVRATVVVQRIEKLKRMIAADPEPGVHVSELTASQLRRALKPSTVVVPGAVIGHDLRLRRGR